MEHYSLVSWILHEFLVNRLTHVKIHDMDIKIERTKSEWQQKPSYQKHKKQRFWQIAFPLGLGLVLILILAVLIVMAAAGGEGNGEISIWADTSLIWLILPVLAFAVIMTVILLVLIYLVGRLTKILPPYAAVVQHYGMVISKKVRLWSNKLVTPIISIKSENARVRAFFSALTGRSKV
jgi:hypothetical protein